MNKNLLELNTSHYLVNGDARDISFIADESVHLVLTSPPYWKLKRYNEHASQMGHIQDYEEFLQELSKGKRATKVVSLYRTVIAHVA